MRQNGRTRVLYVQRPSGGGSATGLVDLIRSLDSSRYDPLVLCYKPNRYCDAYEDAGARVRVLGGRTTAPPLPGTLRQATDGLRDIRTLKQLSRLLRRDLPLARRIARIIRQEEVDLVHHNDNPRADRASILAARFAGVPQICHVRFFSRYYRPVDRLLSAFVSYFVYVSRAIESYTRDWIGLPERKGEVVYDPFDFDALAGPTDGGQRIRMDLGLAEEDRVVANIGRLVPWKGQDVFLEAMARVTRSFPRSYALIVGDDRGGDERRFAQQLRELAGSLEIEDRVAFTGFRDDVPAIMAASEVVVHSSRDPEPFGRVVVEAMAAGRPVVATAAGGVSEIVEDQRNGLLVDPSQAETMARAIESLLAEPRKAAQMASRGQRDVCRRFTAADFAATLDRIYQNTLSG